MKRWILGFALLLLPAVAHAQESIQIEEVGLQGYYSTGVPTPVRIHISAPAKTQQVELEFTTRLNKNAHRLGLYRSDHFRKSLQLVAGQPMDLDVPLMISDHLEAVLNVAMTDSTGREIGRSNQNLNSLILADRPEALVAIYCKDAPRCEAAQSQVMFGGSDEAAKNKRRLKVAILRDLPREWWCYAAVRALILAGPISGLPQDQLMATEYYLRGGGSLVLVENEAADSHFLESYRRDAQKLDSTSVGRGHLWRVPDLQHRDLSKLFEDQDLNYFLEGTGAISPGSSADQLLNMVGVSFTFPRLRSLLIWLGAYILAVGLLNFTLLRRFRKLEWGWVTVTVIALVFAASGYVLSSTRRPKNFTLDDVAVYWMDQGSSVAAEDLALRVSSPVRRSIAISINDDAQLFLPRSYGNSSSGLEIGAEMTGRQHIQEGWGFDLGPPSTIELPMLRWSFRDLDFEGFRKFPGAVHWTSSMHLKNDTGEIFRTAIYLDFTTNRQAILPQIAPGEEINLANVSFQAISDQARQRMLTAGWSDYRIRLNSPTKEPFSIEELTNSAFYIGPASRVFAGVLAQPVPGAKLDIPETKSSALNLVVVYLDKP